MHGPSIRSQYSILVLIALLGFPSTLAKAKEVQEIPISTRGKQYQKVLNALTEQIKRNPRDADSLATRASMYLEDLEFTLAINDATNSLKIRESAAALQTRAEAYRQLNKHEESLKDWTRYVKLVPTGAAYHHKARCNRSLGKVDDAIKDMNSAIKIQPDYPGNYEERAVLFRIKKDYPSAIRDLKQAVKLSPLTNRYLNLGDTQMEAKDFKGAIETYDNAIKTDPTLLKAIYSKAKACEAAGLKVEAAKLKVRAQQIEKDEIGF